MQRKRNTEEVTQSYVLRLGREQVEKTLSVRSRLESRSRTKREYGAEEDACGGNVGSTLLGANDGEDIVTLPHVRVLGNQEIRLGYMMKVVIMLISNATSFGFAS